MHAWRRGTRRLRWERSWEGLSHTDHRVGTYGPATRSVSAIRHSNHNKSISLPSFLSLRLSRPFLPLVPPLWQLPSPPVPQPLQPPSQSASPPSTPPSPGPSQLPPSL